MTLISAIVYITAMVCITIIGVVFIRSL